MAKRKNQWVIKRGDVWAVRGERNSKDTFHKPTQREAIDAARKIARNKRSELIIQNSKGKIRERNSYGNDPRSSKG